MLLEYSDAYTPLSLDPQRSGGFLGVLAGICYAWGPAAIGFGSALLLIFGSHIRSLPGVLLGAGGVGVTFPIASVLSLLAYEAPLKFGVFAGLAGALMVLAAGLAATLLDPRPT